MSLDLDLAREKFESSQDFTIGLEEEFAILDPQTLELAHRFEDVMAACQADEVLAEAAAGELIASEVEIRSGRAETFAEAVERQRERRARLFDVVGGLGLTLGAMGTHPWADYLDQRIIDTPHYNRLRHELGYVAQRNNTWSLHLHMGIRGADRAIAVCDRLRELLPLLLAVSANSPFLDRRDSGLHSVRTRDLHPHLPALRGALAVRRLDHLRRVRRRPWSGSARWSSRPSCGGACGRITASAPSRCGSATRRRAATSPSQLAGLIAACIAQTALDYDECGYDGRGAPLADREIEENLWRAIRHGAGGRMIDFRRGEELPTRSLLEQVLVWTEPARAQLGLDLRCRSETAPSGRARRSIRGSRSRTSTATRWPRRAELTRARTPPSPPDSRRGSANHLLERVEARRRRLRL